MDMILIGVNVDMSSLSKFRPTSAKSMGEASSRIVPQAYDIAYIIA